MAYGETGLYEDEILLRLADAPSHVRRPLLLVRAGLNGGYGAHRPSETDRGGLNGYPKQRTGGAVSCISSLQKNSWIDKFCVELMKSPSGPGLMVLKVSLLRGVSKGSGAHKFSPN